ncbi:uncharacterized protein [Antedon mediterranea]|uniref:uncharacterized protein n=1 Tax=Antedon mediterranea TaxID=105859 RepID=UPI003AF60C09
MAEDRKTTLTLQRRNRKGLVTRSLNTLSALLKTEGVTIVDIDDQLERVDEAFKVVEKAHLALLDVIDDDDIFEQEEEWMAKVEKEYTDQRRSALAHSCELRKVDHGNEKVDAANNQQGTKAVGELKTSSSNLSMDSLVKAMSLPRPELQMYDGNPLRYWPFIRAFDVLMSEVSDDNFKLTTLLKYCRGRASDALQCCLMRPPTEGYKLAREILSERFGDKGTIVQTWVDKIVNRPKIDVAELRQFTDDLSSCRETLDAMGFLGELNNQRSLRSIIDKLPRYLQIRWVKEYQRIKLRGSPPTIAHVVDFVKSASKEANDPVFGSLVSGSVGNKPERQTTSNREPEKRRNKNFAIGSPSCQMCEGSHSLFGCLQFKEKNVEERLSFVKRNRLCFNCLKPGHNASRCLLNRTCSVAGCGQKHTKFLHIIKPKATQQQQQQHQAPASKAQPHQAEQTPAASVPQQPQTQPVGHADKMNTFISLPILPVTIRSPESGIEVDAYALLDSGSTSSFCTERLAKTLKVRGRPENLIINTIGDNESSVPSRIISLEVRGMGGGEPVALPLVYSTRKMTIRSSTSRALKLDEVNKWPHLNGVNLPRLDNSEVDLLIGLDVPDALQPLEIRAGGKGEPYATRTSLGWSLNGPVMGRNEKRSSTFACEIQNNVRLDQILERFWTTDCDVPALDDDDRMMSVNDKRVVKLWDQNVQFKDGHYHLPIPFKQRPPILPDNRHTAEVRLGHLRRKLVKDVSLKAKYAEVIKTLVEENHAEPVGNRNSTFPNWYLPHHAVPKKNGDVRVVFDCAAKHRGLSLNDVVMQGPDLVNSLMGVLLRFRRRQYAIMGDIKSMFHQVRVPPNERDVLRFLWWTDDEMTEVSTYRMCVHLFGGTWCPSASTYALRKAAQDNRAKVDVNITEIVNENFYVDDALISVSTEEEGVRVIKNLTALLSMGGFKLTKWIANSSEILRHVPVEDRATTVKELDLEGATLPSEKALGMKWNVEDDTFGFNVNHKDTPKTRRGVLSALSSVFDPHGFAAPFTLRGKLIVQQLVRRGVDWDESVPDDLLSRWQSWQNDLQNLQHLKIPRCLEDNVFGTVVARELHHFADASEIAYGVTTYLRTTNEDNCTRSALILAKSRLCPMKTVTIPRLELMAATLAVKIDKTLTREIGLKMGKSCFWTDSMIVLQYIKNEERRFKTFVSNRLATIHDGSNPEQWRHVEGIHNPADIVSRGLEARLLVNNKFWLEGPTFLRQDTDKTWPMQPDGYGDVSADDLEVKKSVNVCTNVQDNVVIQHYFDRYSSWVGLKRSVAWILRFKRYVVLKKRNDIQSLICDKLTVDETKQAERVIIQYTQSTRYKDITNIKGLGAFLADDGIIRIGGRIELQTTLTTDQRHQILLPCDNHVTNLVIRHYHLQTGHGGIERTLADIRQKFWLVKGRRSVRRELSQCIVCKRMKARPTDQIMGLLPKSRMQIGEPPFSRVGVDYFGPLVIKRGRTEHKRYGCVFTCMTTRAVHIEVAHSMTTDSFINVLQRFIARRGVPQEMVSDNGTNFVGAKQELRRAMTEWNRQHIDNFMLQKEISWSFNPPKASHMGGVWERQIRTIRTIMYSLVRQQTLDDESLTTLMCVIENIVNSRPITKLSDDPSDDQPLTPNHLLLLRSGPSLPPGHFAEQDIYRRRWRQVQYLADIFWRRWVKEYLPLLQHRQKWGMEKRDLKIGDLVLITDNSTPRYQWPLGLVVDVNVGSDGHVRSVHIRTKGGVYERPITKLCMLERAN